MPTLFVSFLLSLATEDNMDRSNPTCVKFYLCSNPEDSVLERRALRESVFPKLRERCRGVLGLDVRVIDPFESSDPRCWPDENIRQQLIEECRRSSAGPFLLALVGHQYGTASLPVQVGVSDFQLLLQESQRAGVSTQELEAAYRRDENSIPASYRLRPPHRRDTCCPQQAEITEEEEMRMKAKDEELRKVFQSAVRLCVRHSVMSPERAHSLSRSALDADLRFALCSCADGDIIRRCLVYVHRIVNAKGQRERKSQLQTDDTSCDETLFSELCDNFLPGLIASSQLLVYTTTTECDRRHGYTTAKRRRYAQSLCHQVYSDLLGSIDASSGSGSREAAQPDDASAREQGEQEELCGVLSRLYHVARPEEQKIRAYVQQSEPQPPLLVTGGPCTGKTVLLAHCAQQVKSWLPHCDPVVITYFFKLSTNPSSKQLLWSLCHQIDRRYPSSLGRPSCVAITREWRPDISESELTEGLWLLLSIRPSARRPLLLLLDGLDHIDSAPHFMDSVPFPLPPSVKLILTLSCSRTASPQHAGYECVRLASVERKECVKMLESLLSRAGRKVTSGQQTLVNRALTSCCLTLYARLLHLNASLWQSDSDVTESSLPDGVHSSISALLDRLEQKHGSSLVSRAVCYLTLSRVGLTEAELADLLCADPEVLTEYVRRDASPSPKTRVPQVDVERVLLDLRGFLSRRTAAGSQVLFWVSRHFSLVVAKRSLGAAEVRRQIHEAMADYFYGTSRTKTLKIDHQSGPAHIETNFTSSVTDRLNLKKVSELPHHLLKSGRWTEEGHELLASLCFQQAMVGAGLLTDLVAMLESPSCLHLSRERALLASVLRSSACLLQSSSLQLSSVSSVMETSLLPYLELFPALERYAAELKQERRTRGSGLGVALCPAPSSVPPLHRFKFDAKPNVSCREAAGTECGVVAEVMDDGVAWVQKGRGREVVKLSLGREHAELKFAGVKSSGHFLLLYTHCGELLLWDVTGPETLLQVREALGTDTRVDSKIEGFAACQEKVFMWWKEESFVSVFDASTGASTRLQCQSSVTCLLCSSDAVFTFCGQEGGAISIFDTITGRLLSTRSNPGDNAVASMILCEEKWEMACVDRTGGITVWDVSANRTPPRPVAESFTGTKANVLSAHHTVNTLLVCRPHQLVLWDTCDWELWDQFLAPQGRAFTQALLSQDGHLLLASVDACPSVLVWRVGTGECVLSLETSARPRSLLQTASDVVCVAQDGCLTVWDSRMIDAAGAALKMRRGVTEVLVEQAGRCFYAADGSETVWRWTLETGLPRDHFLHDGPVEKLRLSPNSLHLVTLSAGELYVWQTERGENILRVSGSRAADVLVTPNSSFGVSISNRGLSRVWRLTQGNIVCSIHPYLSDAQVSPENTFLIGRRHGDLLAVSLWSGSICKRFSSVESSERVVAFHALTEHPDFVVVMVASGAVYTWKVTEETLCRHFLLPHSFRCQPQHFHMSSDGSYALLSTDDDTINLLDFSQFRLCSVRTEGAVITARLDAAGRHAAYISRPSTLETSSSLRSVLTAVRLADGERIGSVCLDKNVSALVVCEQCVFVGFEDGSIGVYSILDASANEEEPLRWEQNLNGQLKPFPCDAAPRRLPLPTPNITWP